MSTIREFVPNDAEYEAMYQVEAAVYPENADSVADVKHRDASRKPEQFFRRWVVEQDGRLIAFASVTQPPQSDDPGRYRGHITVHPDFEGCGVGTAVYNTLWQAIQDRQPQPTILDAHCYQHHGQAMRFLEKRGFQQVMRWVITRLELPEFDAAHYEPLFARLVATGITFATLPELQRRDEDWLTELHELDWQLTQDEPLPYPPQKMPKEQFNKLFVKAPNVLTEGWIVALHNGRYIGNSSLEKGNKPGGLSTGFTGVLRDYRRRGLATALKAKSMDYAQKAGYSFIRTGNEENNPMLTLNKKLGFREITVNLAYEKQL